ncbi:MAG: aminoglycoside phosphotransferase family protein [Jatrophihabitans sp.]
MTDFPDGPEIALPAGDVTVGVVRIGDTVRRPHQDTSDTVAEHLRFLESAGFAGAPRWLGRDSQGRDVLSFMPGDVPGDPVEPWAASDEVLPGVARLLRQLHDASEGFVLPARPPEPGRPSPRFPEGESVLVAQRDLTPQNTVFRDGQPCSVIDFDLCGHTTRSIDLVNTAMHWVPLCDPVDRPSVYEGCDAAARLRLLYDAYGRDRFDVMTLLDAADLRFTDSYATMEWAAVHRGGGWARMWNEGVGEIIARRITWFAAERDRIAAALQL